MWREWLSRILAADPAPPRPAPLRARAEEMREWLDEAEEPGESEPDGE